MSPVKVAFLFWYIKVYRWVSVNASVFSDTGYFSKKIA